MAFKPGESVAMAAKNHENNIMVAQEGVQKRPEEPHDVERGAKSTTGNASVEKWKPSLHELLLLLSLSLVSLMMALDATVIVTSLSTIVIDLHGTTTQGFWVGTSYLLTCAVTMPFTAALSDIFGRSPLLLSSLALFAIGTIICCTALGFLALLIGRCIQGIGGGGIIILGLVVFTDIVPLRFRPQYYGIIQGAWALGTIIGPLIGGAVAENTTWRWIFYLLFPLCGLGFATIPWLLTLRIKKTTFCEKLARVDWIGGSIFISSMTAILIAFSRAGTEESWGSIRTVIPLVLGIVGVTLSGVWERFIAREPFLRRSLFHCPSSYVTYAGSMAQGLLLYGQLYYTPFFFLSAKQASPIRAGICLLPVLLSLIPASVVIGSVITRINHFRWAIWLGWFLTTLAIGLVIPWNVHTGTVRWTVTQLLLGAGHGLLLTSQNFATQAICHRKEEAAAASMYMFLRSFGMALGVGLGASIYQNGMVTKLRALHLPVDIAAHSAAYIDTLHSIPNEDPFKQDVLQAYVHGFRVVNGFFCAVSGAAGIASLFIGHFDLNKKLESEHVLQEHRWSMQRRTPTQDLCSEDKPEGMRDEEKIEAMKTEADNDTCE